MASWELIEKAIDNLVVNFRYTEWTIGVTDDPERRKGEHERDGEDTTRWRHWDADTKIHAQAVEAVFVGRGMKGEVGGGGGADFVYVF